MPRPGPARSRSPSTRAASAGPTCTSWKERSPARLPIVPGHQAAGRVAAVGSGVEGFAVGDSRRRRLDRLDLRPVPLLPVGPREPLCASATFTGRDRDGGYAETPDGRRALGLSGCRARILRARGAAPLLCAGIIGYRSLRLSGIGPGGRLGLFGFGASAHLAIQVARLLALRGLRVHAARRRIGSSPTRMGAAWVGRHGRRSRRSRSTRRSRSRRRGRRSRGALADRPGRRRRRQRDPHGPAAADSATRRCTASASSGAS